MITNFRERIISGESTKEVTLEAVQHFTNTILDALNPMRESDIIFIITAMEVVSECLAKSDPDADKLSRELLEQMGFNARSFSMPGDTPEPLVNLIKNVLK